MSDNLNPYYQRVGKVAQDAALFKKLFVNPILDSSDSKSRFLPPDARVEPVKKALQGTFLEAMGDNAIVVAGTAANAVANYAGVFDALPSDEVMASAINTMRNMVDTSEMGKENTIKMVMDAATTTANNMSSQDGITKRDHQVALITPVALMQATSDFVTFVPPNYDKSEIFVIDRIAGSTFGDMEMGEVIDETFNKQYATMDQFYVIGAGDGSKTTFTFDISVLSKNKQAMPIRKGYVRAYHGLDLVGQDLQENGFITGNFNDGTGTAVTVSSDAVNYITGIGNVKFSVAPAAGVEIAVAVDIDIEKAPQLIPIIEHTMDSYTVRPHEGAIHVSESIQAVFAAQREFGLELRGLQLTGARNAFAAEKDRKRLRKMWQFAYAHEDFPRLSRDGVSDRDYRTVAVMEFLRKISSNMLQTNRKSGGKGVFSGIALTNYLMSLDGFQIRPNYQQIPQPHYVGRLGEFAVYCDPGAETWKGLMVGKGQNYGDSGFIAADAISAIQYSHPILGPNQGYGKGMRHSDTLYELAYRDIHPYRGRSYFHTFEFVAAQGA